MDKIKIGNFIAQCRKRKSLTQEQLAELLHVTGKSVSKWENGICLPAPDLYEPLCQTLDITVNELFAGQRIQAEDYKAVADRNLSRMLKYRLYQFSDRTLTFEAFDDALTRVSQVVMQLKAFPGKEEAVAFLREKTGFPREECSAAYDFYLHLFQEDML